MRWRARLGLVLGVVLLAVVVLGSQAVLAATPNDVQYNTAPPPPPGVNGVAKPPTTPLPASSGGTLPFTGLDLGVVLGGGSLLVAGGFGLRRLGRRSS